MAKTKIIEPKNNLEEVNNKGREIMENMPIWKAVLKMALPAVIFMLIMGGYMFADNVLAIQFAPDSYGGSKDIVRMGMSAFSPINSFIIAFALLFGMGISTRVSINMGAKKIERAKNTLRTGTMIGMGIAFMLIPILIFSAKPWMASQFESASSGTLSDMGFDYGWIIIMLIPFSFFNQIISMSLRTEGRNKALMLPMIASIFVNLLFDWILMGPVGMGIEGGAWATFISTVMVTFAYIIIVYRKKDSIIRLSNMFGFKFKAMSIIGIVLVGISPFLRNFAQSLTQTVEMNVIKDVSGHIYSHAGRVGAYITDAANGFSIADIQGMFNDPSFSKAIASHNSDQIYKAIEIYARAHSTSITNINNFIYFNRNLVMASAFDKDIVGSIFKNGISLPALTKMIVPVVSANQMTLILTGVFPIFALFFPTIFAFAQASRPIAAYNFGAKNMKRVKETFWWTILFSTIVTVAIYFISSFALSHSLMHVLGVSFDNSHGVSTAARATNVLKIMMLGMPLFSIGIGAMILTGSTDRVIQSIIISSLRGIIFFFPAIYIFKTIAIANPSSEYLFWWFYPVLTATSTVTALIISLFVLKHLDKKVVTLDEKINKIYSKINNRTWLKRKAK